MKVPKVLSFAELADRTYLVEELVTGTHPPATQQARTLDVLFPALWSSYRTLGFGKLETFAHLRKDMIEDQLCLAEIPKGLRYERECREELLKQLRRLPSTAERPLLTAFGHGDLSFGNVILSEAGELVVVDWETAGFMPVVWDLRKLVPTVPAHFSRAVELLRGELKRLGWDDLMSAEGQWIISLAGRVAERSRKAQSRGQSSADEKTLRELRRAGNCLRSGVECS